MQGLLSRWALIIQKYMFDIVYPKGMDNTNADSLSVSNSHPVATTSSQLFTANIQIAQLNDLIIFSRLMYCPILLVLNLQTLKDTASSQLVPTELASTVDC